MEENTPYAERFQIPGNISSTLRSFFISLPAFVPVVATREIFANVIIELVVQTSLHWKAISDQQLFNCLNCRNEGHYDHTRNCKLFYNFIVIFCFYYFRGMGINKFNCRHGKAKGT